MFKRGLIAGFVLLIVGFGLNFIFGVIFPSLASEYQSGQIFRPWTDPLMMAYFGYPFILGLVAAYLWDLLELKNPFKFARIYFIVATIPGMFISYTSFRVSFLMVLSWMVVGYVEALVAGFVFSKIK